MEVFITSPPVSPQDGPWGVRRESAGQAGVEVSLRYGLIDVTLCVVGVLHSDGAERPCVSGDRLDKPHLSIPRVGVSQRIRIPDDDAFNV